MNRLKVLFLLEGQSTPSSRLRVTNYLPFLDRDRFEWTVWPVPNSILSRPSLFRAAARADLVFIQKKLFRPWELTFLARDKGLIYDFDDMVMLPGRDKYQPGQSLAGPRRRRFERTLAAAGLVIAGSAVLKEQAGAALERTIIIPTPVDAKKQPVKRVREVEAGLVAGWIGTRGNLHYLESLTGILRRLSDRCQGLTLRIVCDGSIEPDGVRTEYKTWRLEEEADDLVGFDLGLMPLSDDPWARGKCGFKLLQYMAAGLPVVASPVGANNLIVKDGVNGYLARTEAEWEDRLGRLLNSASLRREMGAAGRRLVEEEYDLEGRAREFARALDLAAGLIKKGGP